MISTICNAVLLCNAGFIFTIVIVFIRFPCIIICFCICFIFGNILKRIYKTATVDTVLNDPKYLDRQVCTNIVISDQTAPEGAT